MTAFDFHSLVMSHLRRIAEHHRKFGPKQIFEPIKETEFTSRRERLFPDDGRGIPTGLLSEKGYKDLRSGLSGAKSRQGPTLVSRKDLAELDACYREYVRSTVVVGKSPKHFSLLLQATEMDVSDLETPEGLFRLLQQVVYDRSVSGDFETATANIKLLLGALTNDPRLKRFRHNKSRLEATLAFIAHAYYRMADPRELHVIQLMRDLYADFSSPSLKIELINHESHHSHDPEAVKTAISMSGKDVYSEWSEKSRGTEWRIALDLCFSLGLRLVDRAPFLDSTVEDGLKRMNEHASNVPSGIYISGKTLTVAFKAANGELDDTLREGLSIRDEMDRMGLNLPHIEMRLLMDEALAFWNVSQGKQASFMYSAVEKYRSARRIARQLGIPLIYGKRRLGAEAYRRMAGEIEVFHGALRIAA